MHAKELQRYDFEKKSLVYKIMNTLHNFCLQESIPKREIDNIVLCGGGLALGDLGIKI